MAVGLISKVNRWSLRHGGGKRAVKGRLLGAVKAVLSKVTRVKRNGATRKPVTR